MPTTTVRVDTDVADQIRHLAAIKRQPASGIVAAAWDRYLQDELPELAERLAPVVSALKKGDANALAQLSPPDEN